MAWACSDPSMALYRPTAMRATMLAMKK